MTVRNHWPIIFALLLAPLPLGCSTSDNANSRSPESPVMATPTRKAVKIRNLLAPKTPLDDFDPGAYLSSLEFYETDSAISESDRDELAQFAHLLAFMAIKSKSTKWPSSVIGQGSSAARALESHFGDLPDWPGVPADGLSYRTLASFLMKHYPPRPPK
jgi:hypothetical protein